MIKIIPKIVGTTLNTKSAEAKGSLPDPKLRNTMDKMLKEAVK